VATAHTIQLPPEIARAIGEAAESLITCYVVMVAKTSSLDASKYDEVRVLRAALEPLSLALWNRADRFLGNIDG